MHFILSMSIMYIALDLLYFYARFYMYNILRLQYIKKFDACLYAIIYNPSSIELKNLAIMSPWQAYGLQ